ncbi:MAG: alpha-L-glutamate ligase-like protein [Cellvibrionaceae bacterium]
MFNTIRKLRQRGIMGINSRNASYIQGYNKRSLYPIVDDKLTTKSYAIDRGLAVPPLYNTIESPGQLKNLKEILDPLEDFVVKPANGSGGDGILVFDGKYGDQYRTVSGRLVSFDEIHTHMIDTLSGVFSLGGQPDTAMIEYRVKFDPVFSKISYQGVPDVRIIVFQGIPVMAMVRLPTRQSGGKANLHQNAIGAGIDVSTGKTLSGVQGNSIVTTHPDTRESIVDVQVPHWDNLLEIAAGCYELCGLGYLGVDLVLDKELGPLILELNARPGLNIQIANNDGLSRRLNIIENLDSIPVDISERISFAKQHFSV